MTLMKDNKKMKAKLDVTNADKKREKRDMLKEINKKLIQHKEHSMGRNESTILAFTDSFEQLFQRQSPNGSSSYPNNAHCQNTVNQTAFHGSIHSACSNYEGIGNRTVN